MKWPLGKIVWGTGKFFFWLSSLMVLLTIIEMLIFPHLRTLTETRDFFSEGGQCYIGGDIGIEVTCDDSPHIKSAMEYLLNIPTFYLFSLFFIPLATLDTVVRFISPPLPGRTSIDSFNDISLVVMMSPLWFLAVASMCYFVWKSSAHFITRFRGNSN